MSPKAESQITRGTRSVRLEYQSPLLSSQACQLPHKIFVWDPNGKYLDCSFPNPVYGHFHGPEKLTGARITDLFSRAVSARLLKKIAGAWKTREEQFTTLTFERTGLRYQAAISCVPTQEGQIIGIVTDRILAGPSSVSHVLPANGHWLNGTHLTPRQYRLVQGVQLGLTNQAIAERDNISLPTVKSQLGKVFRKLGIASRGELFFLILEEALGVKSPPFS